MSNDSDPTGLRHQLREAAKEASPVPSESDIMAKAMFSLRFADRWLAEQVAVESAVMRSEDPGLRSRYIASGRSVEITVERGIDLRVTGFTDPAGEGWTLVKAGPHRQLVRIDEDGMFSTLLPATDEAIDVVLEFDDGVTITMRDVGNQAP